MEVWIGSRGSGFSLIRKSSSWTCVPDPCNKAPGLLILLHDRYANSKHAYTFPRVSAMLGDGKTSYDHDRDNEGSEIGGCSENFRRRGDVPTKARLIYVKGRALQVCPSPSRPMPFPPTRQNIATNMITASLNCKPKSRTSGKSVLKRTWIFRKALILGSQLLPEMLATITSWSHSSLYGILAAHRMT